MKVILNEYIDKLGQEGDVVNVPRGYARNFLIPQKKVMYFSPQSLAEIESKRKIIEEKKKMRSDALLALKEKIAKTSVEFSLKAGLKGVLYGSVTPHMIVETLEAKGINLNRKQVVLPHNLIKHIGTYTLTVQLNPQVTAELKVIVSSADGQGSLDDEVSEEGDAYDKKASTKDSSEKSPESNAERNTDAERSLEIDAKVQSKVGDSDVNKTSLAQSSTEHVQNTQEVAQPEMLKSTQKEQSKEQDEATPSHGIDADSSDTVEDLASDKE